MAKYFVRLDHKTQGPFTLTQLVEMQIRPSTYVWCKGMDDWQKAEDVADVCRAMRCTLAGLPIPGETPSEDLTAGGKTDSRNDMQHITPPGIGFRSFPEPPQQTPDYNIKPKGISIFMALLLTIFFFPPTGLIALWYAYSFRHLWISSEDENLSADTRHQLRVKAYEKARIYRIMSLLTVCIFFILTGVMMALRQ